MNDVTAAPSVMPLFLTDADVRAVFDWPSAIDALRRAYSAPADAAMFPPRGMARGDGFWLRTLSGISPDGALMGAKLIAASIRNRRASYLISLFDQQTVELVALVDAASITGFRTAATSALAVDVLAPVRMLEVAVIGSGFEAKMHLRALAAIRAIARARVFSPNPASRARFVAELVDLGCPIEPVASGPAAVAGADVVICAARSRNETPTLYGDWVGDDATIVSIGSTLPEQREVDVSVIARAGLIVADMVDEVVHDTGDMLAARQAGVTFEPRLRSLAQLLAQSSVAGAKGLRLYKSVGAALQDLVVAGMCVARAREASRGLELPVSVAPVLK